MRLAHRLILAFALGMGALLAIQSALWIRREVVLIHEDAHDNLALVAQTLRPALVQVWRTQGAEAALALLDYADRRLRKVEIHWKPLDGAGAAEGLLGAPRAVRVGEETSLERAGRLFEYLPVRAEGVPPGVLELSQPLTKEHLFVSESVRNVVYTGVGMVVLAVVLAMVLGLWLVGRPLRDLSTQARRIASGDLSGRLAVRRGDEIGRVAAEMNAMADGLGAAQARVVAEHEARLVVVEQLRHAERLSTVGKLAAGIAHELGTPLAVISGRAKMIADGETEGAQAAASARSVLGQVDRMASIIRGLLDFARSGGVPRADAHLADIARDTVLLLTPIARQRGVELAVQADAQLEDQVRADPHQLEQVLANLIMNGIQAMRQGGRLTVQVRASQTEPPAYMSTRDGEYLRIDVLDEGEGIAPAHVAHVFEPFFTTKGVGEGTGLGLSVAYGIVREHGGWIDVDSHVGAGSCFSIHLPHCPAPRPQGDPHA